MFRKVAIVGVAQTDYKDNWAHQSKREMIYEVTKEALSNAGLVKADLDTVIEATSDYWDGTSCSNVPILTAAGAYLKEESKVEDDGAFAFIYAYMRILSGLFNTALVISHTKCSETPPISTLTHVSFDTIYQRPIGLDDISSAALQAQLYMHKYGISEEQMAEISVKNLGNAFNNPHAHRRMKISVEDVFESEILAYPLRALNCRPASDGACAVIMASEEKAKEITDTPAWVKGVGHNVDSYYLGDRD
ncbi:MAG: thiolase family protein, partial [Nitrososphaeria archaeon]|nr:thiolase family protein [Nitrososphaeria archaeon]